MDQRPKKRIVLLDRRCTNHTSKDVINRTAEAIATTAKVQLSRHERIRALLARAASQQAAPTRWRAPAAYGRAVSGYAERWPRRSEVCNDDDWHPGGQNARRLSYNAGEGNQHPDDLPVTPAAHWHSSGTRQLATAKACRR